MQQEQLIPPSSQKQLHEGSSFDWSSGSAEMQLTFPTYLKCKVINCPTRGIYTTSDLEPAVASSSLYP